MSTASLPDRRKPVARPQNAVVYQLLRLFGKCLIPAHEVWSRLSRLKFRSPGRGCLASISSRVPLPVRTIRGPYVQQDCKAHDRDHASSWQQVCKQPFPDVDKRKMAYQ
ncbi:hypothetical protein LHGZ1_2159 [Laribacter hongkongensis]|uniref:Uncharacterized protein n=1 Tax=Laribacter hongkongensis TaxID=168471 RepID=A0A248LJN0_9NEIS|nr:hypothetical protein LHGZ1_2159 [Laribacter hongkongensis]